MDAGKEALLKGDAAAAERSFAEARGAFDQASAGARGPWLRVASWIPLAGRTPDAIRSLADAGSQVADAGRGLAATIAGLPGGLTFLAPSNGSVPVGRIAPLADAVSRADVETGRAVDLLARAPGSLLPGPVADARQKAEEQLRSLHGLLDGASLILNGLPGFLGQGGARRYFFGAVNPAELRGTGGVIGAYSILTVSDGAFSFSKFLPVESLSIPPIDQARPVSPEYARTYDQFRGAMRFWLAINLTPDFPTAAREIINAYEVATGVRLDGVITADPFALQSLMRVTGPAVVPGLGVRVTANNVVDLATNEAYSLFHDPTLRKAVLGDMAQSVFGRFVRHGTPTVGDLRILARTASDGHILVYTTDPSMQKGLADTGVGGAFGAPPGDFFSVVENSAGGNKVDYYEARSVTYSVRLDGDGTGLASAGVGLTNNAPASGQPKYVIGPYEGYSKAGESVALLQLYCAPGCRLEKAARNGSQISPRSGTELGYPFFRDYFGIPSGETADVAYTWRLPKAWQGNSSGGTYRLTFLNQTTIRPVELRVRIQVPASMQIVSVSPGMRIEGDAAVWQGVPDHRLELEVSFRPPLPLRLWRNVVRFLSKPVIHF